MNIEIRNLTSTDIPDAARITTLAFGSPGNRTEELRRCLALQPDGWRLALCDGIPVGTVGAIDYGPFAWIGMMTVLPERQRQGIGERLMVDILEWLDRRGCPLVRLDATQAGAGLYRKFDFKEAGFCYLFLDPKFEPLPDYSYAVVGMQQTDIPEVVAYDEATFGVRRESLMRMYWDGYQGRCFVARSKSGELAGYLVAQNSRFGPWASATPQAAEDLMRTALSLSFDSPLRLIVPSQNVLAIQMYRRLGFAEGPLHWHMARGSRGAAFRLTLIRRI